MTGNQSLRVFISYARSDASAFAEELMAGLEAAGFDPFLDRHDIVPGEDWEARLGHLLQQADTVIYVITPASVGSERCAWEVERAAALAKRVLPVLAIAVDEAQTPEKLRRLNYIHFTDKDRFGASLKQLTTALRTDIDWIREHTRIAELAARWRERTGDESLLMRGGELAAANTWLAGWKPGAPEATANQREFINASEAAEQVRTSEQRQQLDKLIAAQKSRARLLVVLVVVSIVAAVAVGGLLWRYQNELQRNREQLMALQQRYDQASQEFLNEIAGLETTVAAEAPAPPEPGAPPPRAAERAIERSTEEIQSVIQQARDTIGWRIDVFACEGVAGSRQRAERLLGLLNAELRSQRDGASQLPMQLRGARLRTLAASVNERPGYQITRDEIRGEAGEAEQVAALRAFFASHGAQLATRQSSTLTANYLSVFTCGPG